MNANFKKIRPRKIMFQNSSIENAVEIMFVAKPNKFMDPKEVAKEVQKVSDELRAKGVRGTIQSAVHVDQIGQWKGVPSTNIGDHVNVYDISDSMISYIPDVRISAFTIVVLPTAGYGCKTKEQKKFNDCVIDALKKCYPGNWPWKYNANAKAAIFQCEKPRDAKITIEDIPQLEKLLKCRINVRGDVLYISTSNSLIEINLMMINGHCTVDEKYTEKLARTVNTKEKQLMIFKKVVQNKIESFEIYDGTEYSTLTIEEFVRRHKKEFLQDSHVFVKHEPKVFKTMKEDYDKFMEDHKIIFDETKGLINMLKTGSDRKTALHLFDKYVSRSIKPDNILQEEAYWLQNGHRGPLTWAEKEYQGPAYELDFISAYSAILKSNNFLVPIKKGEFKKLTQKEFDRLLIGYKENGVYHGLQTGIYRAIITPGIHPLFRENKMNYYTNLDIKVAKDLGFKIELLQGCDHNALVYHRKCCLTGQQVFGKYVNKLFPLKSKSDRIKSFLSILWGALVMETIVNTTFDINKPFKINDGKSIHMIVPTDDYDMREITLEKPAQLFETGYARMKPFILAACRKKMYDTFHHVTKDIVRIHTDGVFIKKVPEPSKEVVYGTECGDLKNKGYHKDIHIDNLNEVSGLDRKLGKKYR